MFGKRKKGNFKKTERPRVEESLLNLEGLTQGMLVVLGEKKYKKTQGFC